MGGHRARVVLLLSALAVTLAACGVSDARARANPHHHYLLLIGDSLMGNTIAVVPRALDARGLDADIIDAHVNGSGVIGPVGDAPDALAYVKEQIAAHPEADTVVIQWAGACATCGTSGPTHGSTEFFAQWRSGAHAIIDYLHSVVGPGGAPLQVAWVASPPMPIGSTNPVSDQLGTATPLALAWLDATELGPAAGPVTPNWFEALTDTAMHYNQNLIYDGGTHQVRADDLVHLTADGAARSAQWTAAALDEMWSIRRAR
jgi:hypothetical protein